MKILLRILMIVSWFAGSHVSTAAYAGMHGEAVHFSPQGGPPGTLIRVSLVVSVQGVAIEPTFTLISNPHAPGPPPPAVVAGRLTPGQHEIPVGTYLIPDPAEYVCFEVKATLGAATGLFMKGACLQRNPPGTHGNQLRLDPSRQGQFFDLATPTPPGVSHVDLPDLVIQFLNRNQVVVANHGRSSAMGFFVVRQAHPGCTPTGDWTAAGRSERIGPLGPGRSASVRFPAVDRSIMHGTRCYYLRFFADPANEVPESDEGNNTYSQRFDVY